MPVGSAAGDVYERFCRAIDQRPAALTQPVVGLSVSGGGDSIALLHLAARRLGPQNLQVITVDHGLRPAAVQEAALVAKQAAALGIPHHIAQWHWDGSGNLQAAARAGRWAAICDWAMVRNIRCIWMGHTEDDQVETVLMRLARGSGIDGLTAIPASGQHDGLRLFRPLLGIARRDLRDWLRAQKITWAEDASNADPRFDRVRTRQMLAQLTDLGLTRKRLLQTVDHMQAAHVSLQIAAQGFASAHVQQDAGDLLFAEPAQDLTRQDAPRRVMAAGFGWVAGKTYRPRFEQLLETVARARKGITVTLGGCIMSRDADGRLRLTREAAATRPVMRADDAAFAARGVFWDKRWFIEGPLAPDLRFQALGDGIKACALWRNAGMPRLSLLASPAVWRGDTVIAAPLAGLTNGWSARIITNFHATAFAIED